MRNLLLALLLYILPCGVAAIAQQSAYVMNAQPLNVSMLKSSCRIDVCDWMDRRHPGTSQEKLLRLKRDAEFLYLHDLNDLKGAVTIKDTAMALTYVRLLTAYATYNLWQQSDLRFEIVPQSKWKSVPNYGFKAEIEPRIMSSGFMGTLSAKAFENGKFTAPIVKTTPEGFSIQRYILRVDYTKRPEKYYVEKVLEQVDKEGGYHRQVLHSQRAPSLPDSEWSLPEKA